MKAMWCLPILLAAATSAAATPSCCDTNNVPAAATLPAESLAHLEGMWTNAQGRVVSLEDLAGEPRLLAMFFANCATACPVLLADVAKAQAAVSNRTGRVVEAWMFSFDHARDTPSALAAFQKARGADPRRWQFFHGDADSVRELAAALGVQYRRDPTTGDIGHSSRIVLLDTNACPVAVLDGLAVDPKPLVEAAVTLPK